MVVLLLLFLVLGFVPESVAVPVVSEQPRSALTAARGDSAETAVVELLRCHFSGQEKDGLRVSDERKNAIGTTLAAFYASRAYRPAWVSKQMVEDLLLAIEESKDDGLNPNDYHIVRLRQMSGNPQLTAKEQASMDLLFSDALFTLAYHLRYGKVDPERLDPNWNITDPVRKSTLEYRLQGAVSSGQIRAVLDDFRPKHPDYGQLKKGLVRYRAIAKAGGWQKVPEGSPFREGVRDSRVPLLRKRLYDTGTLSEKSTDTSTVCTAAMVESIRRFQKRNGLEEDGIAGPATLRELNVPATERVDQIRLNLERYRWFISDLEPTSILVNIAGFTLQYVEEGIDRWRTRVIVGQPYRETPTFKADMQYIVFNPQWVIPPTILAEDALPAIRRDRSYLSRKQLQVIDSKGRVVNPASVDWSRYSAANFPFRLQQTAGDHGALGRIKFMMPNRHVIYLHDTPSKELFDKSSRTFSSGCIRVENPLDLAELVLRDSVRWSRQKIEDAIKTGKTSTVYLPKRIPVFLLYLTATAENNAVMFRRDVYNRDPILLKSLDEPVPEYKIENCRI